MNNEITGGLEKIREKVRIRDGYICQLCFSPWKKGTRRFDVHHLDKELEGKGHSKGAYAIDKNNVNRMVTLCHKCHLNISYWTKNRDKQRDGMSTIYLIKIKELWDILTPENKKSHPEIEEYIKSI